MEHRWRNLGLVASVGLCSLLPTVGCSGSTSTRRDGAADGSSRDMGADVTPGVCSIRATPTDADLAGCPLTMPAAGSCCPMVGTACYYPGDNDTYRDLALCIDDSNHPPFWQQTLVVDHVACNLPTDAIPLGSAGAPACAARETKLCTACNCAPSDAVCAKRCGGSSGITTPQWELDVDLSELADSCGGLPNESGFQVAFANGCATALAAWMPGPPGTFDGLLQCIEQALDRLHFECADGLACGAISRSTLLAP